ncbi:hypothetical protein B0H12DRAFT_1137712 [Mycena haematopus]|nr:hypothetical protein B0H12DRAFT_1137712 [Mycena haematopus]
MSITWTTLGVACAVIAAAAAFPFIRRDYQTFLEGGPSYAPQNVRGYIIVLRRWLSDLPPRKGPRPRTTSHIIQRQLDQHADPEFAARVLKGAVVPRVQARHTEKTHLSLSKFEFHAEAIFLRPSIPIDDPKHIPSHDTVRRTKREIAHMHDYHDYTLHLALAAQDGKEVVSKGWGQRHPLAGPGVPGPPTEWTFIYAPRDDEEVQVVETIIEASIGYMTNDSAGCLVR